MDRLRHLRKNVGWLGTAQVVFFHLLLALAAIGPALTPQLPWYLSVTVIVCWAIPFFLRNTMVEHWEFTGPFIRRAGLVIVCTSVAAGFVSKDIKAIVPDVALFCCIVAVIALYISAMFWFTSDPAITMTRKR